MFTKTDTPTKTIHVTDTVWGSGYSITTTPIGKDHHRIVVGFENGKMHESTMIYTPEERDKAIAWLQNYTKHSNLYTLLHKFRVHVPDSPF